MGKKLNFHKQVGSARQVRSAKTKNQNQAFNSFSDESTEKSAKLQKKNSQQPRILIFTT